VCVKGLEKTKKENTQQQKTQVHTHNKNSNKKVLDLGC